MTTPIRRALPENEAFDSVFPPEEPGSLCSRPTPVVPAPDSLRALGARSEPAPAVAGPSSRPTLSYDLGGVASTDAWLPISVSPPALEPPSPDPTPDDGTLRPVLETPPRRSRVRATFAKLLFATLFLGVVSLLGYAVKKKLDAGSLAPRAPELLVRLTS